MLLRTLAGSRACQIEDYEMEAGRHALAAGFAEPVDGPERSDTRAAAPTAAAVTTGQPSVKKSKAQKRSGR
jgi:hypothetical protein